MGKNIKDDTVRRLVEDYPTHEFIIDRNEDRDMFRTVRDLRGGTRYLVDKLIEIKMAGPKVHSGLDNHFITRLDQLTKGNDNAQDR